MKTVIFFTRIVKSTNSYRPKIVQIKEKEELVLGSVKAIYRIAVKSVFLFVLN